MSKVRARLAELGLDLPPAPAKGLYDPVCVVNDLAFVSGQVSRDGAATVRGPIERVSAQDALRAAQLSTLRALGALEEAIGDLDKVRRIVRVTGYVLCESQAPKLSAALDGASALLVDIFGARGRHARSAIGVAGLPDGGLIELDLLVQIEGIKE
jgi:enamine deaminase RidA (YjgF/YER057c/UK114 family)